jgi:hypothetical protein
MLQNMRKLNSFTTFFQNRIFQEKHQDTYRNLSNIITLEDTRWPLEY